MDVERVPLALRRRGRTLLIAYIASRQLWARRTISARWLFARAIDRRPSRLWTSEELLQRRLTDDIERSAAEAKEHDRRSRCALNGEDAESATRVRRLHLANHAPDAHVVYENAGGSWDTMQKPALEIWAWGFFCPHPDRSLRRPLQLVPEMIPYASRRTVRVISSDFIPIRVRAGLWTVLWDLEPFVSYVPPETSQTSMDLEAEVANLDLALHANFDAAASGRRKLTTLIIVREHTFPRILLSLYIVIIKRCVE
ncbi:hypothetical protein OBBRIDRAFT_801923 [Obba rivulosa]|uniref:Uncharacterized protein n=1 Tax=Obba rivulosa TaxID=1052685 RepID=A0A8E2DPL6_9APHY|nr:hypothetical protein OBBRIDRAFT_801923 [Obba rivulosa]